VAVLGSVDAEPVEPGQEDVVVLLAQALDVDDARVLVPQPGPDVQRERARVVGQVGRLLEGAGPLVPRRRRRERRRRGGGEEGSSA
jgi:hypothetical protein